MQLQLPRALHSAILSDADTLHNSSCWEPGAELMGPLFSLLTCTHMAGRCTSVSYMQTSVLLMSASQTWQSTKCAAEGVDQPRAPHAVSFDLFSRYLKGASGTHAGGWWV